MNRPLHLARKDARRLGGSLGLWLVLFPLPAALIVLHATGRFITLGPGTPDMLVNVHRVLGVVGFLLAIQIALEDPLHDPDAAWRTRPIRPRDLLLAKLGLAFTALVAAPTLLLVVVWTIAGFSLRDIATLALAQATTHALFASFGLLLGALTRDLGQALLWLAGTLLAVSSLVLTVRKQTTEIPGVLLATAFVAIALALCLLHRHRATTMPRLFAGGLGFAAAILAEQAILFRPSPPPPKTALENPPAPLVPGAELRFGSEQLRLVRMDTDTRRSTPDARVLRLEWHRLAPHSALPPRDTDARLPSPVLASSDGAVLAPLSATTHITHVAGLRFASQELLLPAAACANATWRPFTAPSTSPSAPTP